jgi:hypothetical protein
MRPYPQRVDGLYLAVEVGGCKGGKLGIHCL